MCSDVERNPSAQPRWRILNFIVGEGPRFHRSCRSLFAPDQSNDILLDCLLKEKVMSQIPGQKGAKADKK